MYRQIQVSTQTAASFAMLEHILRVSTSKKEADEVLHSLSEPLRSKITELIRRKQREAQQPLHELSLKISVKDLEKMQDPMIVATCYNYIDGKLKLKREEPGAGKLPECFMLKIGKALYLLYTPQMTTLDGYDPFTGNTIFPILTEEMVLVFSNSLYTLAHGSHVKDKYQEIATPVQPRLDTISIESEEEVQDYIEDNHDSSISRESLESQNIPSEIEDLTDSDSNSNLEDISIDQKALDDPPTPIPQQQERSKPKVEKWKEVEHRIHEERKKRDMCGSECIVI